jgi:hypothetical protein|tara:strand:+ start:375 stop:551 length:177 start_codon:yes stop_codon:yes gene_type:complete
MLLTAEKANEFGIALLEAAKQSREAEQQYLIVCTLDTFTAIPFREACGYDPNEDILVA